MNTKMAKRLVTMRSAHAALLVATVLAVSACTSAPTSRCKAGEEAAVHDTLYLGTGTPTGVVTLEEWSTFLETVVTPRFPQGLTVSEVAGQWRGSDGAIVRESTHVLQVVHPDNASSEQQVAEIASAYKAQFQQEAVLRVRAHACVSF